MKIRINGVPGSLAARPAFLVLSQRGLGDGLRVIPELGLTTSKQVLVTLGSLVMARADYKARLTALIEEPLVDGLDVRVAKMIVTVIMDRLLQLGQPAKGNRLVHEFQSVEVRWEGYPADFFSGSWLNPEQLSPADFEWVIADLELELAVVRDRACAAAGDDEAVGIWTEMIQRMEARLADLQSR